MTTALQELKILCEMMQANKIEFTWQGVIDKIDTLMPKERETHKDCFMTGILPRTLPFDFTFKRDYPTHPSNK